MCHHEQKSKGKFRGAGTVSNFYINVLTSGRGSGLIIISDPYMRRGKRNEKSSIAQKAHP